MYTTAIISILLYSTIKGCIEIPCDKRLIVDIPKQHKSLFDNLNNFDVFVDLVTIMVVAIKNLSCYICCMCYFKCMLTYKNLFLWTK